MAFQFIGVTDIQFVHAEGLDLGSESREKAIVAARAEIQQLVSSW